MRNDNVRMNAVVEPQGSDILGAGAGANAAAAGAQGSVCEAG